MNLHDFRARPGRGRSAAPLAAVLLLASCSTPLGPIVSLDLELTARPAVAERSLNWVTIPVSVQLRNQGDRTAYLATCSGSNSPAVLLEKLEGGEWRTAIEMICAAVSLPPMPLRPGQSVLYERAYAGSLVESMGPRFLAEELSGTYRATVWVFRRRDRRDESPPAEIHSEPFQVVDPIGG